MILTRYKSPLFTGHLLPALIATAMISAVLTGCGGSSSGSSSDNPATDTPTTNNAPVANAGADQNVTTGDSVNLSGSQSSDADGDSLTYSWSFSSVPGGSSASLSTDSASNTSFTADLAGSYTLSLVVNDGTVSSSADSVTIIAAADNSDQDSPVYTRGAGSTTISNLFASGTRVAPLGSITDDDNGSWTVPAEVRYSDNSMPFASDLYNVYQSGHDYDSAEQALAALIAGDGSDIIEIDTDGELITAYIFADNYFELYINGTAVGKDPVPFTDFNSNIVRFRVNQPFTAAMLLVDWEENLATGTEANQGSNYHPGDGGMVAVFKDSNNDIIGITDSSWKAQTYYTAPLTDTSCLSQFNHQRLSASCSTSAPDSLDSISAAHWARPDNWMASSFDDSSWPAASTFSNDTVGVDNKASYTNFTDVFDDSSVDASFIWSTNLVLDNEVLVRATIGSSDDDMTLSSDAVKSDMILPLDATCDGTGQGSFPTLNWDNAPAGTQSFAITMHNFANENDQGDFSKAHSYQVLYDIPANISSLATGETTIGTFGINGIDGEQGYSAPCSQSPIANDYIITLYALSDAVGSLGLDGTGTGLVTLTDAIAGSTLTSTSLTLSRVRYNPNNDDHVPTSVPSDCAAKSATFAAYSDLVSLSCTSTTMTVTTHTMLPYRSQLDGDKANVGIRSWIGRVPIEEQSSWTLPLQPDYLSSTASNINIHDAIGISVEGVPILHYAKENTNGEIARLGQDYSDRDTILLGEVDQCGAHAGNGEDYHYHMAPLCMMDSHDPSQPLAYMFDGIPLYFGTAGGAATEGGTD
ncbi:PKD domain-containing protein [Thalassomonas sp. RHCl1]|uniref:PKD domain-containing protein n=1 Tax=Thalassomonas sp. RHCl1 TaxID=2995320 RepID=UPI00248B0971|nr:PKD domain-containing protein [Thalassomonas sp. RHCl1]